MAGRGPFYVQHYGPAQVTPLGGCPINTSWRDLRLAELATRIHADDAGRGPGLTCRRRAGRGITGEGQGAEERLHW